VASSKLAAAWWWKLVAGLACALSVHRGCEIDRLKQELAAARASLSRHTYEPDLARRADAAYVAGAKASH
jgi:hypothetical protein